MTPFSVCVTCLAVLTLTLVAMVIGQSCPYKECRCSRRQIECQERHLDQVPQLLNKTSTQSSLDLEGNNITHLPASSFPDNLTELLLLKNPISSIDIDAFNGSEHSLTYIAFANANFQRIPDALINLQTLEILSLQDMPVQDWNDVVMKRIGATLTEVSLVNDSLRSWPDWLSHTPRLTSLTLKTNIISTIPDNAMAAWVKTLVTLDISNNMLTEVPKAISNLTALKSVHLEYNKIMNVKWLPSQSNLTELFMNNNNIFDVHELNKAVRPYAKSMFNLDISQNSLTAIPELLLFTNIYEMDLTNNKIFDAISGSLTVTVTFLDLDYNFLPAIPRIFWNLTEVRNIEMIYNVVRQIRAQDIPPWIYSLALGNNLIEELTDASFPETSALATLDLVSNPLVTISDDAFKYLTQLSSLSIQDTKITRLPLALTSLNSLTWLEIENNNELICTCQEKSVGLWFLSRHLTTAGSCGHISITDFFVKFIQFCP